MIAEIYACGHNNTSAFIVKEAENIVHYGSYKWGDNISFGGVNAPADDLNCEILAVICGLMMCRNDGRQLVNIYTDDVSCQKRYYRNDCESPFFASFLSNSEGMDIYAEPWIDHPQNGDFKTACLEMTSIKQNGIQQR